MIEVVRDEQGNITAVIEYLIFQEGRLDEQGNSIFIGELEINPAHRRKHILRYFIKTLLSKYPKLETCVFFREYKYPGRGYKTYTRKQFELLTKE